MRRALAVEQHWHPVDDNVPHPDGQLAQIRNPDGATIGLGYDTAGRLNGISFNRGTLTQDYDAATGNWDVGTVGPDNTATLKIKAKVTDPETGAVQTAHTTNDVEFVYVNDADRTRALRPHGVLADIGPTLLQCLGLAIPAPMTAETLFA